jgi:hypothetical protein
MIGVVFLLQLLWLLRVNNKNTKFLSQAAAIPPLGTSTFSSPPLLAADADEGRWTQRSNRTSMAGFIANSKPFFYNNEMKGSLNKHQNLELYVNFLLYFSISISPFDGLLNFLWAIQLAPQLFWGNARYTS